MSISSAINRLITASDLAPNAFPFRGVPKCCKLLFGHAPATVVVVMVVAETRPEPVPVEVQSADRVDFFCPAITPPTLYALQ